LSWDKPIGLFEDKLVALKSHFYLDKISTITSKESSGLQKQQTVARVDKSEGEKF
jgi:hypothetical protein